MYKKTLLILCIAALGACVSQATRLEREENLYKLRRDWMLVSTANLICPKIGIDYTHFGKVAKAQGVRYKDIISSADTFKDCDKACKHLVPDDFVFMAPLLRVADGKEGKMSLNLKKLTKKEKRNMCDTAWRFYGNEGMREKRLLSKDERIVNLSKAMMYLEAMAGTEEGRKKLSEMAKKRKEAKKVKKK